MIEADLLIKTLSCVYVVFNDNTNLSMYFLFPMLKMNSSSINVRSMFFFTQISDNLSNN